MQRRILVAVVCAGFLAAVPAASAQTSHARFVETVEKHYESWAQNRNGQLTAARVDQLLRDPKIKGEAAAALATIHLYQRAHRGDDGKIDHPAVGLPFLKEHAFERGFERAMKRVAAPRALFVEDLPSIDGLKQGPLGDCFFLSPLAAAVHCSPKAVRNMIRPRPDGTYEVAFGDGERFHVQLTDGLIGISSVSGDNGIWPSVFEEAFGLHRLKVTGHRGLALDAINTGGGARYAIEVLTGYRTKQVVLYHAKPMTASRAAELERELRPVLSRARQRLVTTYAVGGNHPPNIATNHVYAILDFDAQRSIVTVRNPWGHKFQPKEQPPGLQNGYPTERGIFKVPLAEFVRIFSGVTYETTERLR